MYFNVDKLSRRDKQKKPLYFKVKETAESEQFSLKISNPSFVFCSRSCLK